MQPIHCVIVSNMQLALRLPLPALVLLLFSVHSTESADTVLFVCSRSCRIVFVVYDLESDAVRFLFPQKYS